MNTITANQSTFNNSKLKDAAATALSLFLIYGSALGFIALTALTWVKFLNWKAYLPRR